MTKDLNKDASSLAEDDDLFKEAAPMLFGEGFEQKLKNHVEAVRCLRKSSAANFFFEGAVPTGTTSEGRELQRRQKGEAVQEPQASQRLNEHNGRTNFSCTTCIKNHVMQKNLLSQIWGFRHGNRTCCMQTPSKGRHATGKGSGSSSGFLCETTLSNTAVGANHHGPNRRDTINGRKTGNPEKQAIQPSTPRGGFISSVFLVPPKDGGQRPVINLKRLNEWGIHVVKDTICRGDWMDLKDAYFAVSIHKDHRQYQFQGTTFQVTTYQFQCLLFGLSCAPWAFTKVTKPFVALLRQLGVKLVAEREARRIIVLSDSGPCGYIYSYIYMSIWVGLPRGR